MPLMRIRTEIEDRPGRLAVLTAALAEQGANILDLSVQVGPDGVVDEFVVDLPAERSDALIPAVEAAGGVRSAAVPARPHELIDEPTRVLALAARLRAEPRALPQVLAELLRATEASWVVGPAASDRPADVLIVPVGHLRAVRLHRPALPFTVTEAARADALVRAVLPVSGAVPTSRRVLLKDGTEVVVRPIVTADAEAIRAMHDRCSRESRRLRYFSPKPAPPRRSLERFCEPAHGLTLVAEGPDGSVLALAHLIHVLDPGVAELGFLVEDAWQGRGLGRALAELLLEPARERGLVELRATVLSENARMRRLLTALGGRVRRTGEPGVLEIRLRLDGRPTGPAGEAVARSR
ncbi:GNAT family N-acetyltransferase [Actinomadura craniellae]|uniref:GNAT family N-acetyltransferase n=1 Tax=Actinomadura craniellae TaxID=2231787 RepID=A0A365H4C1_9ACTN|nr:GNAT family N-acetyltransferase [Actinomadura craniellae]RAY13899.1 GNAT family N-acetyltransferase [Actinomadura craniellae]